ncbi:MAG: HD domain-containing protein [Clostridium sp.]|nr:HD domain-containing protein [Clostridium sp.]
MEKRLIDQIKFIVEVDKAKEIMRRTYVTNSERFENDAEHSWHLALMAPLLKEYIKEDVNIERVINMVIIHDLVEIDAGDTFCYDKEGNLTKREREVKAADRIFNILPKDQAKIIYDLWNEFEEMKTIESKYAACLDRIQPILNNIATCGKAWKENNTTKSMVLGRMNVIKETSEELWELVLAIVNEGVNLGALKDE